MKGHYVLCDMWLIRVKDALRKRFGHAMHWYGVLVNEKNRTVRRAVDIHRPSGETNEVVDKGIERGGPERSPSKFTQLRYVLSPELS